MLDFVLEWTDVGQVGQVRGFGLFRDLLNIDRQSEIENTSYNNYIKGCLPLNYSPDEFYVTSLIDMWSILKCLNRMRILTYMKRLSKSKIEQAFIFFLVVILG